MWMHLLRWLIIPIAFLTMALPRIAHAKDVRLALLVGNEVGWKADPKLHYVMDGDVLPFAQVLRNIGFTVKVLKNKDASSIRAALRWAKERVAQAPKVTTFLFYYTGHADRIALHTGPKTGQPLRYKELVSFMRDLPVQRRIAFVDACFSGEIIRQFGSLSAYRDLVRKGASGYQPIDISKTIPHQGEEKGLQVITSSANYAWESKRYKASVFTYHMLRGLRGKADRDRDGKISVNELFNYVSDSMVRDIRQKPQMFGVVHRSRPYALAPAYHSRLEIDSSVIGTLQVSVANFVWKRNKKQRKPLHLSVVHGWGTVELKKGKQCWKQRIYLPKGGNARLHKQWESSTCTRVSYTRKGTLELPSRVYVPPFEGELEISFGTRASEVLTNEWPMFGGEVGMRFNWFGLFAEAWGGMASFNNGINQQRMYLGIRAEAGYYGKWNQWSLFAGGYVGGGLLLQDLTTPSNAGLLFRYGLSLSPGFWFHRHWGLALQAQGGFSLGQFGGEWRNQLDGSLRLALRYRF